jgi:hypothetical protein
MGCDIHAYIEYGPTSVERELGTKEWVGFFGAINLDRDYGLFAALSDTRNNGDIEPISEPRGLPATVSSWVASENTLLVSESEKNEAGCTPRDRAEHWVEGGTSQWVGPDKSRITHPDWHSHSWVDADEFEEAMRRAKCTSPVARATLASMRQLPNAVLVFWYDN